MTMTVMMRQLPRHYKEAGKPGRGDVFYRVGAIVAHWHCLLLVDGGGVDGADGCGSYEIKHFMIVMWLVWFCLSSHSKNMVWCDIMIC